MLRRFRLRVALSWMSKSVAGIPTYKGDYYEYVDCRTCMWTPAQMTKYKDTDGTIKLEFEHY